MPTAEERAMGAVMLRSWARFAATGDPNGGDDPPWPRYDASRDAYLDLATPPRIAERFRSAQCDFWDPLLDASL
jgi:para-nitrobenzyl esterase